MGFLVPAFLAGLVAAGRSDRAAPAASRQGHAAPLPVADVRRAAADPHRAAPTHHRLAAPAAARARDRAARARLRAAALVASRRWCAPRRSARTVVVLLDRSMSMGHRAVWRRGAGFARGASSQSLGADDRVGARAVRRPGRGRAAAHDGQGAALAALAKAKPSAARDALRRGAARGATDRDRRAHRHRAGGRRGRLRLPAQRHGGARRSRSADVAARAPGRACSDGARANTSVAVAEARPVGDGARERLAVSGDDPVARRAGGRADVGRCSDSTAGRAARELVDRCGRRARRASCSIPCALPAGLVRGELTIDPDSLAADDTARFALTSNDAVRVLLVAPDDADRDETLYIERALAVGRVAVGAHRAACARRRSTRSGCEDAALVILWDVAPPTGSAGAALTAMDDDAVVASCGRRRVAPRDASARRRSCPPAASGLADRSDDRGGSLGDVRLDHPLLAPFRETPAALAAPRFLRHARLEPAHGGEVVARFDDGSAAVVERTRRDGPRDRGRRAARCARRRLPAAAGVSALRAPARAVRDAAATRRRSRARRGRELADPRVGARARRVHAGRIDHPAAARHAAPRACRCARRGSTCCTTARRASAPVGELAVNIPSSESDLGVVAPDDLLAGVRRSGASVGDADPTPPPVEIERRQGLWRLAILAARRAPAGSRC